MMIGYIRSFPIKYSRHLALHLCLPALILLVNTVLTRADGSANISSSCTSTQDVLYEIESTAELKKFDLLNWDDFFKLWDVSYAPYSFDTKDVFPDFVRDVRIDQITGHKMFTYSECLPANSCYLAHYHRLDPEEQDAIKIKVSGGEANLVYPIPYDNTTNQVFVELGGGCVPNCQKNESLFELELYNGDWSGTDWVLRGVPSRDVVLSCHVSKLCSEDSVLYLPFQVIRRCLPSDTCYNAAFGTMFGKWTEDIQYGNPHFSVRWDGLKMEPESFNTKYSMVELGSGCENYDCGGDESSLEVFVLRDSHRWVPPMSLKVTEGDSLLLEHRWKNTSQFNLANKHLHYYQACVTSQACLNLTISVPQTFTMGALSYIETGGWQVSLGDTIFESHLYELGQTSVGGNSDDVVAQFVFERSLGIGECTRQDLCKNNIPSKNATLLDVTFETSEEYNEEGFVELQWWVDDLNNVAKNNHNPIAASFQKFDNFLPGRSYRSYDCIPSYKCTKFAIYNNGSYSEYSVTVNGVEKDRRFSEFGDEILLTPLGCSSGVMAGIFFAVAVSFGTLVLFG